MRAELANLVHAVLRRLPAARNVYAQRDALEAALAAAEARAPEPPPAPPAPAGDAGLNRHLRLALESGFGAIAGCLHRLDADGPLGARGDMLLLPFDDAMSPLVLRDRAWQSEELGFLQAHVDSARRYALIDVGANIGLFARQAQRAIGNIDQIACIEADPLNFSALAYNMAHLPGSLVSLHHVALAERAGRLTWYRDAENFGNYSLNPDAMRGRPCTTLTVEAAEAGAFFTAHPPPAEARLIWKSDTQGYDEAIITRLPDSLWDRVDLAIIELWRIAKPNFDRDAFRRRIGAFTNRTIGIDQPASVAEVMEYIDGSDYGFADLYMWR